MCARFGREQVFMDVEIKPGEDFVKRITKGVGQCDVLIALIGRQWLAVTGPGGERRLDDPEDFPRIEISAALERTGTQVIPVLVGGAKMPSAEELPEALSDLSRRQALEVRDVSWEFDLDRLIKAIEEEAGIVPEPPAEPGAAGAPGGRRRRGRSLALAGILALAVAGGAGALVASSGSHGGSDGRLSGAAFSAKMDQICRKHRARNDTYHLEQITSAQYGEVIDPLDRDVKAFFDDLRSVKPPANLQRDYDAYINLSSTFAKLALEFDRRLVQAGAVEPQQIAYVQQQNSQLVDEAFSDLERSDALRGKVGIGDCLNLPFPAQKQGP